MTLSFRYFIGVSLMLFFLVKGCENDIERINLITEEAQTPRLMGSNIEVIYSDSAKVKVQVLSPEYKQFPDVDRPYTEFPQGLEVFFYDDSLKVESEIRAEYAIYYQEENLWHATTKVVAQRRDNGDALYTEELFWDQKNELIYSNSYTRVHNEDNTLYGKRGFKSHQSLSNWQLIGSSGTINVQDEE